MSRATPKINVFGTYLPTKRKLIKELADEAKNGMPDFTGFEGSQYCDDKVAAVMATIAAWSKDLTLPIPSIEKARIIRDICDAATLKVIQEDCYFDEAIKHWLDV